MRTIFHLRHPRRRLKPTDVSYNLFRCKLISSTTRKILLTRSSPFHSHQNASTNKVPKKGSCGLFEMSDVLLGIDETKCLNYCV